VSHDVIERWYCFAAGTRFLAGIIMSEHNDGHDDDGPEHHHHHACANLFGCGDEMGTGIIREDIKDAALDDRATDRLLHMDEVDQETFDGYLSERGRWRRKFLQASSFMGALAAVEPWFGRLARAEKADAAPRREPQGEGRVHVVPSTRTTVRLGVFDANLPPILTIDSGDTIRFPDTWSHFLNEMQPGVPLDTLAKLRLSNPGKGPHSIIGPIGVNKAEPGDVLEIRCQRIRPTNGAPSTTIRARSAPASCRRIIRRGKSSTSIWTCAP
jgi:hypothetical protein